MPRVVGPRIAASTTYPPPAVAPQARHLMTGRTAVQPSAVYHQLHRWTSSRTCPDRPHSLAKPRPVRPLIRRADELLHVHKLMHQYLVAQVEPRALHGGIAGRPVQQTSDSHDKGRPVRIRPDRPKLAHGRGWQEIDTHERKAAAKHLAVELLRPSLQASNEAGVCAIQTTWRPQALHRGSAASSRRTRSSCPPSRA